MLKSEYDLLVQKYYTAIKNYCYVKMRSKDAAADCVQEVFMLLYNRINSFVYSDTSRIWLYKTADKVMSRYWKKQRSDVSLDGIELEAVDTTAPISAGYEVLDSIVSKDELELLEEYYIKGTTIKMLAKKYSISEAAVYKRIERIKARITRHKEDLI